MVRFVSTYLNISKKYMATFDLILNFNVFMTKSSSSLRFVLISIHTQDSVTSDASENLNERLTEDQVSTHYTQPGPYPGSILGGCKTLKKWTFWTSPLTSPLNPPTKTSFLAHFVAKSGLFRRFGACIAPPGYRPVHSHLPQRSHSLMHPSTQIRARQRSR